MKNLFKFGFLAFALTLGLASCGESKTAEAVDNATEAVQGAADSAAATIDSTAAATVDSVAAKVDSAKK